MDVPDEQCWDGPAPVMWLIPECHLSSSGYLFGSRSGSAAWTSSPSGGTTTVRHCTQLTTLKTGSIPSLIVCLLFKITARLGRQTASSIYCLTKILWTHPEDKVSFSLWDARSNKTNLLAHLCYNAAERFVFAYSPRQRPFSWRAAVIHGNRMHV